MRFYKDILVLFLLFFHLLSRYEEVGEDFLNIGLIQIHKDLNSEIKLNFVNFELETAEFIRENVLWKILKKKFLL